MKEYTIETSNVSYTPHSIITFIDKKVKSMILIDNNDNSKNEIKEQSNALEKKGFSKK